MSNQFQYGSQRLNIRRPPAPFAAMTAAGGFLLLLLVIISVIINLRSLSIAVDNLANTQTMFIVFLAIVTLVLFIISLTRIGVGLREWIAPMMAANIPREYGNKMDVYSAFVNRVISTYQFNAQGGVRTLYGPNTLFMSPVEREVVRKASSGISGHIVGLVFGVLFLIAAIILGNQTGDKTVILPFVLYLVLMIGLIFMDYASGFAVVPRQQPNTVCAEGVEYYQGFGHPSQLIARLPDLALPLRWQGFINRSDRELHEEASATVGNVGQFKGYAFVEQQPQPISSGSQVGGYLLAGAGWLLTLIGAALFLLFLVPSTFWTGATVTTSYIPVYIFAMFMLATACTSNGNRLMNSAKVLFKSARFRSTAIFMDIVGTLSRAEVRVGKSLQDAVEASAVAVRSDFTTRFYAAELISESPTLDGPRSLLALNHTSEAEHWIGFFREQISKLREERVRPVGVDLQSGEAQEILQANVALSGARAGAMHSAEMAAGQQAVQGYLGSSGGAIGQASKACPYCAEQIPAQAKFCRFCGAKI